jgi:hypothetical protein
LKQGHDFEISVRETTGLSLPQFEREWRRTVRDRYSLATWLLAGGGWGLFALVLWGLVRLRRRADRERRAALDIGWEVPPETPALAELDRTPER